MDRLHLPSSAFHVARCGQVGSDSGCPAWDIPSRGGFGHSVCSLGTTCVVCSSKNDALKKTERALPQ